jgi:hypothetical protein
VTDLCAHQRLHPDAVTGERWWGGAVADGQLMPFGVRLRRDLGRSAGIAGEDNERFGNNQAAPLLLSTRGRFIWSEAPFHYEIGDGVSMPSGVTWRTAGPARALAMPSGPRPRRSSRPPGKRLRCKCSEPRSTTPGSRCPTAKHEGVLSYAQVCSTPVSRRAC